ncbi:hypothetical protein J7F03_40160 [Streptomyces sp. ISL-43]|uniref:hypothetical protein n=1 Tax=Streptomyces sp. ISL-43 TaxID=2819183 RepID=UPI001BEC3743|nr:hypothetical protein [Streptomyces sp. ISL-43]MBT2453129.1 hypothetical protein [Streptomyces sp. ISL-43]
MLLAPVAAITLIALGRLWVPGAPGDALVLTRIELVGTWQDGHGGRLALAEDGTFRASNVCGDYSDSALETSSGFGLASVRTGTGTWENDDSDFSGEMTTEIRSDYVPGRVWTQYEASGTAAAPMLWTYIGDPDHGERCILKKETAR